MKKSIKKLITMSLIIILFVVMGIKDVNAITATASLVASKEKVKAGESFSITLKASSEEGLNGIVTNLEYDTDKLELTEKKAGTNWQDLSADSEIALICNATDTIKTADVYTLTFKAKENATGEAQIKTGKITVDTMSTEATSAVEVEAKTIKVTIEKGSTNPADDPTDKPADDPADKPADDPTNDPTNDPTKDQTNNPTNNPKDNSSKGSGSNNGATSKTNDSTISKSDHAKAGLETLIVPTIVVVAFGIVSFIGYKKFNKK